jgi:hypothetical protein
MENKDQNNQNPTGVNENLQGLDSIHEAPSDVNSLSAEPEAFASPLVSQERKESPWTRFFKATRKLDVILGVLLLIGVAVAAFAINNRSQERNSANPSATENFGTVQVPLGEIVDGKNLAIGGGNSNVTINGQLQLSDALYLVPTLQPTGAKAGQIYYDKNTNQLAYFNGEQFVFLTSPSPSQGNIQTLTGVQSLAGATGQFTLGQGLTLNGNQLSNSGVLSVQGESGDVSLTAGPGIVINGTNFSNSGVISISAGSPNVIVNNDGNGNVTIDIAAVPGSGTVTSSGGTSGSIPLFTGAQNIEDSIITQSGLTVTISGDLSVVTGGLTLSSALTVSNGGTGATSLAANGVLIGNGTAAVSSVPAGGAGLCLLSTAGAPVWAACPSAAAVTSLNGLTGALNIANASGAGTTITLDDASNVTKGIASFNGTNFTVAGGAVNTVQNINTTATPTFAGVNTNSITPSAALTVGVSAQTALLQGSTTTITSNGAGNNIVLNSAASIELQDNTNITGNATLTGDIAVNGGDITSTGALNITPGGALTVGSTSQALTLQGGATTSVRATNGANTTIVAFTSPTANTTLNFPALTAGTYTICTTAGNCSGAAATLQSVYDNSSNPEIILDATRGALTIRDNSTPLGANLLEVQNNAGSSTYLAVTTSGIAVTGTATVGGNINSSTGTLQTNGTSRIDNSGNAVNLGSVTLSGAISGGTTITGSGNVNSTGGGLQTNSVTRIDNSGNLVNIAAITASGSATFQGGDVTLGTSSQAGGVVINDGSSNTGTLQVAALGQNTTFILPDPGAGTATICLTSGNCAGSGGGVTTGGGTTNRIAKFTGAQALGDSSIADDGTNVTVTVDVIIQGGDLTVGTTSQAASIVLNDGNGQTTTLQAGNSAGNLSFILPTNAGGANQCLKQSGVGNQLVWQDCDGGSGGSSSTLQTAYNNSTDPEITLNSSVGGLSIRDNSTPLGANLFEIQNNLGSTTYLAVSVSGVSVTGTTSSTGNINSSGGALQTNGTSRVDNSGNLVNIGNITGTGAVTVASVGVGNDITINGADQFIVQDASVFNALSTFNANIDLGANDIVGTTSDIDLTNFDVAGSTGNVTAGTYNGQTISSSANFTGSVAIATNANLGGDIAVNGGDITSTGALNITPGGALTMGISAATALLQGSTTTITSNGAGNDIVLNSAASIELQDNTNVTGNVTLTGDIAVNGGDLTSTGALNITPGGALTLGSTTQALTLQGGATTTLRATSGANTTTVAFTNPIANTTLNFPASAAGTYTICTTVGNCSGAAANLQSVYDNSNDPEIILDATRGALSLRDNNTPLGANLLEVQNNAGSTTYFAVTASGVAATGTTTVSGNINSTGGGLQTNGTTRVDNSGNLINIGSVTGSGSATFQGGGLTLGTNAQAGSIVLNDGSSNTGTLQVAALGQNTVYTLPDPGAGTATICLTTGNCAGSGTGVTTSGGTTNRIAKFTGAQALGDSTISDNGTDVTVSVDVIIQGGDLTVGTTSQAASIVLNDGNGQTTTLQAGDSAGNLTFILPTTVGGANQCLKQSGVGNQLVWQDCDGGAGGSSSTLQTAYNNSATPEITLDATRGALTLRDNNTPLGANLFEIQNNLGSTTYLAVTVSGLSVTGTTSSTGNINSSGGTIQTNGTSRIDNSGNLVNIGNITGTGAVTIASVGAGNDITINGADQFIVQDSAVFNALSTFNANIDLGTNDLVGTTADIDLTNFDVVGSTGNVTAGTYNGQTISSSANFTGSVAVAGNTTLTGDIAVNGGDLTSTGALNITPGGTLTVGATGQQLILQGNASTRLTATGGGQTTTVSFNGTPTGAVTYNFDRAAAAGTYSICTSIGNCSGVGGAVTTSGGTTGTLAKFTGSQTLADSLLSESGSTMTVNGNLNLVSGNQFQVNGTQISSANLSNDANLAKLSASQTFTGNAVAFQNGTNSTNAFNIQNQTGGRVLTVDTTGGQVVLGVGSTLDGKLVFSNVSNTNTVTILPGTPTANHTLTLPNASGIICTDSGNCAGAGATLQTGYNFSVGGTTPKIKVNSSLLGVDIQDADTTIAANLFNIRASNGAGLGSVMFGVGSTGDVTMQNSSNSATAFRLLTQGGTSVLTGDTTGGQVLLGQSGTLSGTLVFRNSGNANTITISTPAPTANRTLTLPNASGTICLDSGNCASAGGGVTTAGGTTNRLPVFNGSQTLADSWLFQNSSTLEIDSTRNLSLLGGNLSVTGTGQFSNTLSANGAFAANGNTTIGDANSDTLTLTAILQGASPIVFEGGTADANELTLSIGTLTADRTITLPNEDGTVCLQGATSCGFAAASGSANYIQNQNAGAQATSNFWISGTGRADTAITTPRIDTATAAALTIGDTNATAINIGKTGSNIVTTITGTTTIKPSTGNDSTSAFRVLNAGSSELVNVDSVNSIVSLLGNNTGHLPTFTAGTTLTAGRWGGASVVLNGYVYVIAGSSTSFCTASNTVQYAKLNADGTLGTWGTTTVLPGSFCEPGAAAYNGYIYAQGEGSGTIYRAKPDVATGLISSWTALTPTGASTGGNIRLAAYNGYLYELNINSPAINYARINSDGTIGTFSTMANWFSGSSRRSAGIAFANGYFYSVGGAATGAGDTTVYYAKVNSDGTFATAATTTALPNTRAYLGVTVANGYIYAMGGGDGTTEQNTIYYAQLGATGTIGSWTTDSTTLTAPMDSMGVVQHNGYIYTLGGWDGSVAVNTTSYTSTPRVRVGGSLDLLSYGGENNTEGGTGGSLTAGNTNLVGSLNVADQATFRSGVSVQGGMSVAGELNAGSFSGAGLTSCNSINSKLLYNATTKQFSCGSDKPNVIANKASDQSSTNAFTSDSTYTFTMAANETWVYTINTAYAITGDTQDVTFRVNAPASSTCRLDISNLYNVWNTTTSVCGGSVDIRHWAGSADTNDQQYTIWGTITTGATPGDMQLQWMRQDGTGSVISRAKGTMMAYKLTGVDLAEAYYTDDSSITPGTVVGLGDGAVASVKKTSGAYDSHALGVVSTAPGHILGDPNRPIGAGERPVLLALSGRIPVRVSLENGPILPGDYLTTSSTPGVAMKATKPGQMIGKALEGFSSTNPDAQGSVMTFANLTYADPNTSTTANNDLQNGTYGDLNVAGTTTTQNLKVTGKADINELIVGTMSTNNLKVKGSMAISGDINLDGVGKSRNAITKKFVASKHIPIGSVVIVDPINDGQVTSTTVMADTRVLGVALTEAEAGEEVTVAIGGSVQVMSANASMIQGGDLMVSSSQEGFAEKSVAPIPGSMVGKALGKSDDGQLVWILISLH